MKNRILPILILLAALGASVLTTHATVAQEGPVARITLPIRGQTLHGNLTIQGTATSPQFARYIVAYAAEPDLANWTDINGVLQPQPNGMLAVWNTHPIPDGKYALRLQVFNTDGSVVESVVRDITLSNTAAPALGVQATTSITETSGATVSDTVALGTSANDTSLDLSDIPRSFTSGAKYALYAFVALGVYVLLKKGLWVIIHRVFRKRVDYGR